MTDHTDQCPTLAGGDLSFSCVVDSAARYQLEAHYWIISLLELAGISPNNINLNFVGRVDPGFGRWLAKTGVNVRRLPRFPGSPYCNKLQQLALLPEFATSHVVLTDCDTVVLSGAGWPAVPDLAAKMVDTANPPESWLRGIFVAAGLDEPTWVTSDLGPSTEGWNTDANNRNGGVYLIQRQFGETIAPYWQAWARWSLARLNLYGPSPISVDQVSLALAARQLGCRLSLLPREFNFPTHHELPPEAAGQRPVVVHHHHQYDSDLLIRKVGVTSVDDCLDRLNSALRTHRSEELVHRLASPARDLRDNIEKVTRRKADRLALRVRRHIDTTGRRPDLIVEGFGAWRTNPQELEPDRLRGAIGAGCGSEREPGSSEAFDAFIDPVARRDSGSPLG